MELKKFTILAPECFNVIEQYYLKLKYLGLNFPVYIYICYYLHYVTMAASLILRFHFKDKISRNVEWKTWEIPVISENWMLTVNGRLLRYNVGYKEVSWKELGTDSSCPAQGTVGFTSGGYKHGGTKGGCQLT